MSAVAPPAELHRGRLVLGALMLLLAVAALAQEWGVVTLQLRYLAPALLVAAGVVLLVSGAARAGR
ncbi:hypothetical protein [Aquipuribacter sp. MA13-6]|uniref:hypothetical protein n=1 Tax=unclassified Aquipuribacter TaxID=2635084 RepID=UPI003EE98F59